MLIHSLYSISPITAFYRGSDKLFFAGGPKIFFPWVEDLSSTGKRSSIRRKKAESQGEKPDLSVQKQRIKALLSNN